MFFNNKASVEHTKITDQKKNFPSKDSFTQKGK